MSSQIACNIKWARELAGLGQKQLGFEVSQIVGRGARYTGAAVSNWENARRVPSAKCLLAIAEVCKVKVCQLLAPNGSAHLSTECNGACSSAFGIDGGAQ